MDPIEECFELDWTDGLPVVPPTPERVEAMLAGRDGGEVIAVLDPGRGEATVEKIAANAVMAGCRPEYFPVVLAAVRAAAEPRFGLDGVLTTIHSQTPLIIVNGPVIDDLGFNYQSNVFGSGTRANATVGRALNLVFRNIAGARAGALDSATLGHPGKFSYCIAEYELATDWLPLHVERGHDRKTSTVTLYAADAPLCTAMMGATGPDTILRTIADSLTIAGTYNITKGGNLGIVMCPEHARICADAGLSKADVRQRLFELAQRPAGELRGLGVTTFGDRPERQKFEGDPNRSICPVYSPDDFILVVAGGEVGGYSAVVFGGGRSVTKSIEG
jgi:hypothetical protein